METSANKTIITVVGKDTVGIIAKNRVNVMDISQTIVQGFFNMMMIVDLSGTEKPFADISKELAQIGEEIGVDIKCQREEIFEKMHRI